MKNFKDNKGFAKAMVIISVLLLSAIGVSLYFILTSSNSIKKEEYNLPSQLTNKNDPTTGGKGIVILEKNLGQLIFQGTSAGLEGISPKGFVGGKSAVYSGAIVVGGRIKRAALITLMGDGIIDGILIVGFLILQFGPDIDRFHPVVATILVGQRNVVSPFGAQASGDTCFHRRQTWR